MLTHIFTHCAFLPKHMFTRVDSQQEGVLAWPCKELLSSAFKPVAMASYSLRDSLNLQMSNRNNPKAISNSRSPCMTQENGPDGHTNMMYCLHIPNFLEDCRAGWHQLSRKISCFHILWRNETYLIRACMSVTGAASLALIYIPVQTWYLMLNFPTVM